MSRKQKWKGVPLNHTNIDEYMSDLYSSTSGQYITQGVSFNKDDNFQMTLLKNALLSHGSFSGFIKHLMFNYFEERGKIEENVFIPNHTVEKQVTETVKGQSETVPPTSPAPVNSEPVEQQEPENTVKQEPEPVEQPIVQTTNSAPQATQTDEKTEKRARGGRRNGINKSYLDPVE